MTEQPPSAEAIRLANCWVQPYLPTKTSDANAYSCAQAIDALCEQRVSAERERCFRWALGRIPRSRACQAIRDGDDPHAAHVPKGPSLCWRCGETLHPGHCCAPAERPAPEGSQQGGYVIEIEFDDCDVAQRAYDAIEGLLREMGQLGTLGMRSPAEQTGQPGCGATVWRPIMSLLNNLSGIWQGYGFRLRAVMGNTNYTVIADLIKEIDEPPALPSSAPSAPASTGEQPDKEER